MKVDLDVFSRFFHNLSKESFYLMDLMVISSLEKLLGSLCYARLSVVLENLSKQKTQRSSRFLNLWLANFEDWDSSQDLPQFNVTKTTTTDLLEAIALTLTEVLAVSEPKDSSTLVEVLSRLFHQWNCISVGGSGSIMSKKCCDENLLDCCELVSRLVVKDLALQDCSGSDQMDFLNSSLEFFTFTADHCTSLVSSKNQKLIQRLIDVASSCLLNPKRDQVREVFWKSSILLPKVGRLYKGSSFVEIMSSTRFLDLYRRVHIWKRLDWKSEAMFAMLSDLIQVFGKKRMQPLLIPFKEALLTGIHFKELRTPAKNNAVYALGLLVETCPEDLKEEELIECIQAFQTLLDESSLKDEIFHDNVIAAIARISCLYLDPDVVPLLLPILHEELPLKKEIDENVTVLRFWKAWVTHPIVKPALPGLLDAAFRIMACFPEEEKIIKVLSTVLKKVQRHYPEYWVRMSLLKPRVARIQTSTKVAQPVV